MKASTGVRTQRDPASARGPGRAGCRIGRSDHQSGPARGGVDRLARVRCAGRRPRRGAPRPVGLASGVLGGISPAVDLLDQEALVDVPRHDRRPALASLERRRPAAEVEPALLLVGAVAADARVSERIFLDRLEAAAASPGSDGPSQPDDHDRQDDPRTHQNSPIDPWLSMTRRPSEASFIMADDRIKGPARASLPEAARPARSSQPRRGRGWGSG